MKNMNLGMIQIGKLAFCLLFILIIDGCFLSDEDNIVGVYVGQNYTNAIDTLFIMDDGKYLRILYRKDDRSLVYKHSGTWKYSEGYIDLDSFLVNLDVRFEKGEKEWDDALMYVSLPVRRKLNLEINIIEDYDMNLYYKKIKGALPPNKPDRDHR